MTGREWLVAIAVVAAAGAVGWSYSATYEAGHKAGKQECEALQSKSNEKAQVKANKKTRADLGRAQQVGNDQEQGRVAVDAFFDQLAKESSHEAADPVDSCVLPDVRLRRWNAANAGRLDTAHQGAAAGQPDPAASAAADRTHGENARSGGQPPGGDTGLPPVGYPNVQPAEVLGDQS